MTLNTYATQSHSDPRGRHDKFFASKNAINGERFKVREVFMTTNHVNVLRGMHFQRVKPQRKLLTCVRGSAMACMVNFDGLRPLIDFRKLDSRNADARQIFAGTNDALGYFILEEDTEMLYIADEDFYGEYDAGFDPLSFRWPEEVNLGDAILSERDQNLQSLDEYFEELKKSQL